MVEGRMRMRGRSRRGIIITIIITMSVKNPRNISTSRHMVGSSSPGGVMPRKKLSLRFLTDTDPQFMSMEEVLMRKVRDQLGLVIPPLLIIASTMLSSVVLCSSLCVFENPEDMGVCLLKRKMMRTLARTTFGFCLMEI
jgi:hypothetical protein